jgi:hypothetical protein
MRRKRKARRIEKDETGKQREETDAHGKKKETRRKIWAEKKKRRKNEAEKKRREHGSRKKRRKQKRKMRAGENEIGRNCRIRRREIKKKGGEELKMQRIREGEKERGDAINTGSRNKKIARAKTGNARKEGKKKSKSQGYFWNFRNKRRKDQIGLGPNLFGHPRPNCSKAHCPICYGHPLLPSPIRFGP